MTDPTVNPDRIYYIQVNNNSDVDFEDMYDGVPVTIEAHSTKNIRAEMANHLFGWTETADRAAMMKYTTRRHGWNTQEYNVRENGKTLAERTFDLFEIKKVAYRMVEDVPPNLEAPIPADPLPESLPPLPGRPSPKNPYLDQAVSQERT